ncbi:hypothetical protein AAZX31_10G062900 [Glycine max]
MKTIIERCVSASATRICAPLSYTKYPCNNINMFATCSASSSSTTRRPLSLSLISTTFSAFIFSLPPPAPSSSSPFPSSKFPVSKFFEIPNSGGVKALELLDGSGEVPSDGDQVAIHYYGRLAAKQGWRFDSTYDHKDNNGDPNPFVFVLGSGKVWKGENLTENNFSTNFKMGFAIIILMQIQVLSVILFVHLCKGKYFCS